MNESQILHKLIDVIHYKEEYQKKHSKLQKNLEFLLERIYLNKNISPIQLSKMYNLPPSTLTGQLDKLEKEGLIKRIYSKEDRRSITLDVTEKGREIIDEHKKSDEQFTRNFFNALDGEKKETFIQLLSVLLDNVDVNSLFSEEA